MLNTKKVAALIAALALAGITAPTAIATPSTKGKCNSGNGNGQETSVENDCDPGNSGGHNSGGG